ncbi:MAG: cobalamin-binding protein [Acidobacteria bacterium]|nr:cobalamin-binding protein [Acidobacteriota bacterium]
MMMRKVFGYALSVAFVLSVLLTGCKTSTTGTTASPSGPTHVVTDDLGRSVTLPVEVRRVVSLAPSVTESVFAVGAGDKLVGDTTYCNYPEQAKAIAKVGDTMNPNMETIVGLKPDIVLVSTASQIEAFTKTLEQNGIAVYVMNPTSLDGVLTDLGKLGDMLGTPEKAGNLVLEIRRRINNVNASLVGADKTTVFVQISKEPLFTTGRDAFLNSVINAAGGRSVTSSVATAFPKLSKETASTLNPEVIILSDSEDNAAPNEAFNSSPAVTQKRVYKINADIISRPGPRLVDALEQIAADLHPEVFTSIKGASY